MNPTFLKEFNAAHDDLMDRLIKEGGTNNSKPEKEFSIIDKLKEIAEEG